MASIGSLLRELREQRGVSLEELARSTRINPRFLAALEMDDFAAVPAGPFAKGFIRACCEALGSPPEALLAQCSLPTRDPAGLPEPPSGSRLVPRGSPTPLLVSLTLFVGLGLALAAVTLALKPSRDEALPRPAPTRSGADGAATYTADAAAPGPLVENRAPASAMTGPSVEVAPVPAPPGPVADPGPAAPVLRTPRAAEAPSRLSPVAKAKSYRLVARTSQVTRIRLRLDGRRTVEETIPAGAVREWISSRPFELRIVNAGGVTLELNGRILPPLGALGTTVHRLVLPTEPR
jgi:cytoskeletal protein RodZ